MLVPRLVVLLCLLGIFRMRVETNPVGYLKDGSPIKNNFNDIYKSLSGSFPINIVMGHTDCGAMKGAMNREAVASLPKVYEWLGYACEAAEAATESDENPLLVVTEANVLLQLKHLLTHPAVASGLESGQLDLHGWVYHIGTGEVTCHDAATNQFVPIADHYANLLT